MTLIDLVNCWEMSLFFALTCVEYLHDAISMVHTCSSNGKFDNSIMQLNFNFNLKGKSEGKKLLNDRMASFSTLSLFDTELFF